jgi:hypothetical protein
MIQFHADERMEWQCPLHQKKGENGVMVIDETKPVFILAPVTGSIGSALIRKHTDADAMDLEQEARLIRMTISASLRDWRNVAGADGVLRPFKADAKGKPSDESMAILETDSIICFGLGRHILNSIFVTGGQLGNSNSAT